MAAASDVDVTQPLPKPEANVGADLYGSDDGLHAPARRSRRTRVAHRRIRRLHRESP